MTSSLLNRFLKGSSGSPSLRNEAGMATGIVMLLSSILMITALSIMALSQEYSVRDLRYLHFHSLISLVRVNVYAFGQNTNAWKAGVVFNKSASRMACIDTGSDCSGTSYEMVALRLPNVSSAAGSPYYFQNDAVRNGFQLDGSTCAYNGTRVTGGCVLHANINWVPFCGGSDCKVWPEKVNFFLDFSIPTRDQFNKPITDRAFFLPTYINKQDSDVLLRNPYR